MKSRMIQGIQSIAAAIRWAATTLFSRGFAQTRPEVRRDAAARTTGRRRAAPVRGDERTYRRIAEMQNGGQSSEESAARYRSGENPGGLHHRAVRREVPEHQRPSQEEPQERKETIRRGRKHIAVSRRGA